MGADSTNDQGGQGPAPGPQGPASTPQAASGQQGAAGAAPGGDRLDRLEAKVDSLIGSLHQGSQTAVQARLDAPGATADEVRRQIEERDRQRAAEQAEQAKDGRLQALEDKVTGMAEQAPEPPLRRVEKFMGWR